MPDKKILEEGLSIISQCKQQTGDIWQAHIGAAVIASYFFMKENRLPIEMERVITDQSRSMREKYVSEIREEGAEQVDYQKAESIILESLGETIDELHWVGHNVIYAALSLAALEELGGWSTKSGVEGIAELIRSFAKTIPGRSWIGFSASEVKKVEINKSDGIHEITDSKQLSVFILDELSLFKQIYHAEAHHDLIGHMLTFSHALNILFDLGHVTYFRRGLPPLYKLVKVLRASRDLDLNSPIRLISPVDHLPLVRAKRMERLPIEPEFWSRDFSENEWDFGHIFKFPFSFYNHMNRVPGEKAREIENFRYIINLV